MPANTLFLILSSQQYALKLKSLLNWLALLLCCHLVLLAANTSAASWLPLAPGLNLAYFPLGQDQEALIILRIDPSKVQFVLGSAAEGRHEPLTLPQWAKAKRLLAVINASMYLPDNRTSTGYMRQGAILNNGRISKKFGAFFVASPDSPRLARATIIERETQGLREKLSHYHLVVQNYRLINSSRQVLWPRNGAAHTIAAVAVTGKGDILFLHATKPLSPHALALELLKLPLDIRTTMYVEGGGQAGLFIDHPAFRDPQKQLPIFFQKTFMPLLPNVLGIKASNAS